MNQNFKSGRRGSFPACAVPRTLWLALFAVLAMTAGCGYRFMGEGVLPAGIRTVHVAMFENHTRETGFEAAITREVTAEMMRLNPAILRSSGRADGSLSGTLRSMEIRSSSHADTYRATEREVVVVLDVVLTDSAGQVAWERKGLVWTRTFAVAADRVETEANKKAALEYISRRLAEQVVEQVTAAF